MSKILIALYMNLLPSLGLHGQRHHYGIGGQSHTSEESSKQPRDHDPLAGSAFCQPDDRSVLIKKSKWELHGRH